MGFYSVFQMMPKTRKTALLSRFWLYSAVFPMAEMERFELSRRLPDLPHFECGPFSHLGTSPYTACKTDYIGPTMYIISSVGKKVNSFFVY